MNDTHILFQGSFENKQEYSQNLAKNGGKRQTCAGYSQTFDSMANTQSSKQMHKVLASWLGHILTTTTRHDYDFRRLIGRCLKSVSHFSIIDDIRYKIVNFWWYTIQKPELELNTLRLTSCWKGRQLKKPQNSHKQSAEQTLRFGKALKVYDLNVIHTYRMALFLSERK